MEGKLGLAGIGDGGEDLACKRGGGDSKLGNFIGISFGNWWRGCFFRGGVIVIVTSANFLQEAILYFPETVFRRNWA